MHSRLKEKTESGAGQKGRQHFALRGNGIRTKVGESVDG